MSTGWDTLLPHLREEERVFVEDALLNEKQQIWHPLPGPQTMAFESKADIIGFGGAAGGGKGVVYGTDVVTPFGFRKVEDLRVGDTVLSRDGTGTKVIGIYPQPEQPIYRVGFDDDSVVFTDGPHRWLYSIARKGKWKKSGREWKIATTEQLLKLKASGKHILIPLCEPLRFTKTYKVNMRPVDPYVLGLLLGDGYTAQQPPSCRWTFSTKDAELLSALPGDWVHDNRCSYRLRGPMLVELTDAFKRLGLDGCRGDTKFIPEPYLLGDVECRLAVLQGLMDTDGTASRDGKAYFTSTSERLVEDVRHLVMSLGGRGTITCRTPTCTNGIKGPVKGAVAWTVYIRMPDNKMLFRLERKRSRANVYGHEILKRRIHSITEHGKAKTICLAVDHPESLFLVTKDMIVTHNTDVMVGKMLMQHRTGLIVRQEAQQLKGIVNRIVELVGSREGYNSQDKEWRNLGPRDVYLEFGTLANPGDEQKQQGRAKDFLGIDEATNVSEEQARFLMGWVRTTVLGQPAQTVLTFNPPTTQEGRWVIKFFAPWLDKKHPKPAQPGELRWFAVKDGKDIEVPDDTPFIWGPNGERITSFNPADYTGVKQTLVIKPKSRTFIPSRITDNPFLVNTGYLSQLQALPEPLRSQMLYGDFNAGVKEDPWQVIPTEWVEIAQARWKKKEVPLPPMDSLGVDVARGGDDSTIMIPRHKAWFDEPRVYPGSETPDGPKTAGLVITEARDGAPIHIDVIGVGSAPYDFLMDAGQNVIGVNVAERARGTDKSGRLQFFNLRSELVWKVRELLDPANNTGAAIPPSEELKADLCAYRWQLRGGKVWVEGKDDIVKRLGRSPDYASALILANMEGPRATNFRQRVMESQLGLDKLRERVDTRFTSAYDPYGKLET